MHNVVANIIMLSRHTVMCQRPRKTYGTQVCYLQELLSCCFQPFVSLELATGPMYSKFIYIFPFIPHPRLILHPQLVPQCGTIQIQTTLKW